jgi:hypothetical protein
MFFHIVAASGLWMEVFPSSVQFETTVMVTFSLPAVPTEHRTITLGEMGDEGLRALRILADALPHRKIIART